MISMIAAKSVNNVIGRDNDLPWAGLLPSDMAFFVAQTKGKPVIMGRATFDSIGRPLPKRTNVVITRDKNWSAEGVLIAHSIEEAIALVSDSEEIMIIGGAKIYEQCMTIADRLYITQIDLFVDGGDAFFPEITGEWTEVSRDSKLIDEKNHFNHSFIVYEKS